MDDLYGITPPVEYSPENIILPLSDYKQSTTYGGYQMMFGEEWLAAAISEANDDSVTPENGKIIPRDEDLTRVIKAKIAAHPRYPMLLQAYIDCQKVGASPVIACLLDEIRQEKNDSSNNNYQMDVGSTCLGADPELDEFMDTYCEMLVKYKSDLSKPFDEASTFLNKMETQLVNLCHGISIRSPSDDGGVSSEEELSGADVDHVLEPQPINEDRDLKDRLFRKYGGHIGSLKLEFSKKRKKGKLPKEAKQILLEWWNIHNRWPYPTDGDKIALAEITGLDQKQINNWFINQRKRHWKPLDNLPFSLMDNISGHYVSDSATVLGPGGSVSNLKQTTTVLAFQTAFERLSKMIYLLLRNTRPRRDQLYAYFFRMKNVIDKATKS